MTAGSQLQQQLDLCGTPCPINFIRCRLALEGLEPHQRLQVDIDRGEPEAMVIPGLREAGHRVEIIAEEQNRVRLLVTCLGG